LWGACLYLIFPSPSLFWQLKPIVYMFLVIFFYLDTI
jgi:hypothetical protein